MGVCDASALLGLPRVSQFSKVYESRRGSVGFSRLRFPRVGIPPATSGRKPPPIEPSRWDPPNRSEGRLRETGEGPASQRTMETAQALYGVTQEEPGVSKIVSVRFD